jgi:large subunit ribosomal protein L2
MTYSTMEEVTRKEPEKSLLVPLKQTGGRNALGRITCRYRGGGHKRHYRILDFKRDKDGIPAKVAGIEYDPNRSAHIALLHYVDGESVTSWRLRTPGRDRVLGSGGRSGPAMPCPEGHSLGTFVHNIELEPRARGRWPGGRLLRPAHGQGRQTRLAQAAFGRSAHGLPDVRRRSARWGTSSTRKFASAKPVENDG